MCLGQGGALHVYMRVLHVVAFGLCCILPPRKHTTPGKTHGSSVVCAFAVGCQNGDVVVYDMITRGAACTLQCSFEAECALPSLNCVLESSLSEADPVGCILCAKIVGGIMVVGLATVFAPINVRFGQCAGAPACHRAEGTLWK